MKRLLSLILICLPALLWAQGAMRQLQHMHQVRKGETWAAIAARYGVSEQALRQANPDVKTKKDKPRKGELLCIPETCPPPEPPPAPVATVSTSMASLNIGVLLPLEEDSGRGAKMVEFYQGLLMAADSVRRGGTDITIHALHTGSTRASMQQLLSAHKQELQHTQVIFGPVDDEQIEPLNEFCMQHGIRLVMPFAHTRGNANQPLAYTATAPANVSTADAAALVDRVMGNDANYVIVNTSKPDTRGALFTGKLKEQLATRGVAARVLNIDGDDFAYESALNQTQVNCIVPDNTGIKSLNILCTKLRDFSAEHPQYRLRLVGYPEWNTYTKTLLESFFQFDTYTFCTYYSHPLSDSTVSFGRSFASNFGHPMATSFPCYAMMGFDMGYHFMHGLATQGDTFEDRQGGLNPQPAQHHFTFRQDTEGGGRMNHFVQLVHYSPDQKITLVR